jgi:molecular chaperone Hsp33
MKNVLRTLVFGGQVSLTLANTTEIVREGIQLHKLSALSGYVFGKALSAMTFMSACLKENTGEISLSLKTEGACQEIAVSGNRALRIRGYIGNTHMSGECDEANEGNALQGNGSLTIIRDDGYSRPFVGACAIPDNAGVDEAFEEYYRISEQLPTFIATEVEMGENGCSFAGVAVLQPLPFADEKTLEKVRACDLKALLSQLKNKDIESVAKESFDTDEGVWETRKAAYKCNCSRRYLTRVLVSLGEEQLRAIIREDGAARIHCHYCNTDYEFTEEDADELFS